METWHNTHLSADSLIENKITEADTDVKKVCLLKRGPEIFAFTALCPHAGAPLCDGWTDSSGKVVCPLHKYRFDPKTGRNVTGEGYSLFRYATRVTDGYVWVRFI